jgi:hypothetical protein
MIDNTPEEIIEMAENLIKDISDSKDDLDVTSTASFVDRCTQIVKNLAESVAELHQRVDMLTEKE